ncbi:hypothetical protein DM02DRAFT_619094 [Periconia macrospinosa]|uniref:EthD domain-containing protein n=1 Tax=Periconia macrospinosa TaxID=97972 RepID=A0A2V1D986_9PLEO|nr:hypothetical protein DM02DRAFT_619094 [Periconia macrospinosa]
MEPTLSSLSALTVTETITETSHTADSHAMENGTAHTVTSSAHASAPEEPASTSTSAPQSRPKVPMGISTVNLPRSEANDALILLFSKKEGLSFAEFKRKIEEEWVPTLEKVTGPLFPLTYVRRYIARKDNDAVRDQDGPLGLPSLMIGREEDLLFDCLIEATYEDNLHMMQFFSLINEEEPANKLLECEATFSDINKLKIIIMENRVTINRTRQLKGWEE